MSGGAKVSNRNFLKKYKVYLSWNKKCPEFAVGQCEEYTFEGLNSMLSVLGEGGLGAGLSAQSDSNTEKERAE